jgi:hypothetical protein
MRSGVMDTADLEYVQIRTNTLFAPASQKHVHGGSVSNPNTAASPTT